MSTTINNTPAGYTVKNPMSGRVERFNSILQAIDYCRMSGLIYSLAF